MKWEVIILSGWALEATYLGEAINSIIFHLQVQQFSVLIDMYAASKYNIRLKCTKVFDVLMTIVLMLMMTVTGWRGVEVPESRSSREWYPRVPQGSRTHADHRPWQHCTHVWGGAGQRKLTYAGTCWVSLNYYIELYHKICQTCSNIIYSQTSLNLT